MTSNDASQRWDGAVKVVFKEDLATKILNAGDTYPELQPLFTEIAGFTNKYQQYVDQQHQQIQQLQQVQQVEQASQPANEKKRKLEDGAAAGPSNQQNGVISRPEATFECKDVSVQIPARKKLKFSLVRDAQDAHRAEVRLLNPTTNDLEYALPASQIEDVFTMPVPDKQARQAYFAIVPKLEAVSADGKPVEQILFTLAETSPPSAAMSSSGPISEDETYVSATHTAIAALIAPYGKRIITPEEAEFASAKPQSHRKGEKGYHVSAHRGSKEGYLYFLPNGILFGFKKPLAFFRFSDITSISYTSVLQRTFNLVIAYTEANSPDEVKEVEFSMLDQGDFAGIDDYVKRHGLNDASMAADRRAKAYNVNKEKKAEVNGDASGAAGTEGVDEDGMTELQRAEQQLQDEEDEEEEDYEASGGESEGEGEDSEEEEDGEEYDEEGVQYDDDEERDEA